MLSLIPISDDKWGRTPPVSDRLSSAPMASNKKIFFSVNRFTRRCLFIGDFNGVQVNVVDKLLLRTQRLSLLRILGAIVGA